MTPDKPTTPTEPTTPDTPAETFTSGVYRVTVDSELSVRSSPSTSGTLVGVLKNGAEIAVDSISNGWAHIMDNSSGSGRYCSAADLTRMRDYVSGDEDNDPIQPPRTSHIDGVKTVIIDPGHGGSDVGANNGGSLDEKHVNLYVAQYLKQYPVSYTHLDVYKRQALATPPLYLSARTVATSTMQSGVRPALRHLMSMNFSAPRSAPKPASVMAISPSLSASLVACTLLQPCAILANGPPCIRQGVPSSV